MIQKVGTKARTKARTKAGTKARTKAGTKAGNKMQKTCFKINRGRTHNARNYNLSEKAGGFLRRYVLRGN